MEPATSEKTELRWGFRTLARGEVNGDPTNAEFFAANSLSDALIREVIQNSLDARAGDAPVQIRILVPEHRADGPDAEFWRELGIDPAPVRARRR